MSKKVVGFVLLFVIDVGVLAAMAWICSLTGERSFLDVFLPGLAVGGAVSLLMVFITVIVNKFF